MAGDVDMRRRLSIVEEGDKSAFSYGLLAIVGSFSVNGVAQLHTDLLKVDCSPISYSLWPKKFNNKTNGVTQRRWLAHCNPGLRDLINSAIGGKWEADLSEIEKLAPLADDAEFRKQWQMVKLENKRRAVRLRLKKYGCRFGVDAIFDVQVKRIHEYKRQLLNVLHVIHVYDRICRGDTHRLRTRCVLIGVENSEVLLGVPDGVIYNSNNIRNILPSSYRRGIPLIGFSQGYVRAGAFFVCAVFHTATTGRAGQ